MRSLLDRQEASIRFAGHETFPCRYGWLKKSFDAIDLATSDEDRRKVFLADSAIATFGVGKNMVASMRHWSLACGVLESMGVKGKTLDLFTTTLGRTIFGGGDPYLEQPGSLWALHWRLVSNPSHATAWYYAFNEFNDAIFTRDLLASKLMTRLNDLRETGRLSDTRITRRTVERDVECFIRTYMPKVGGRAGAEDSLECPFAELGLLAPLVGVGAVQFRRGPKPSLPDAVFAFALIEFWQNHYGSRGSLSVETIAHEPGSPGRAFVLDEDSIVERLERLERLSGKSLLWDESSGLRQVTARAPIEKLKGEAMLAPLYGKIALAA